MWEDFSKKKPDEGSKCLVVFEQSCGDDDKNRWMDIDLFEDGNFVFLTNWEDECAVVGLPIGSLVAKCRAVCWMYADIDPRPLSFNLFD